MLKHRYILRQNSDGNFPSGTHNLVLLISSEANISVALLRVGKNCQSITWNEAHGSENSLYPVSSFPKPDTHQVWREVGAFSDTDHGTPKYQQS